MKKLYILLIALFMVNGALAQWVPQNSGTTNNLNSVYFTDANTGYAVGDSGTILKTINGGTNWMTQSSGVTYHLTSVHFPRIDTGYVVGDSTILKTTDGGVNWISQSAPILHNYRSVFFTSTDTGYTVGGYQQGDSTVVFVLKTVNGGTLWSINYSYKKSSDKGGLNSIYFTNANTGYAVGSFHHSSGNNSHYMSIILKTSNGGNGWTIYPIDMSVEWTSVYFPDPDLGYIVGHWITSENGLVGHGISSIKSTDGGISWAGGGIGGSCSGWVSLLSSVYFTDASTGYTVGLCDGVLMLKTTDSGTEWLNQDVGGCLLNSVFFAGIDTGYAVGWNGCILKTTNGGYVGITDPHQDTDNLSISPNPASTTITISSLAKGSLSILNISGQAIQQQLITAPATTIDVSRLKKGVYLVKVVGEKGVQVGKFIKL